MTLLTEINLTTMMEGRISSNTIKIIADTQEIEIRLRYRVKVGHSKKIIRTHLKDFSMEAMIEALTSGE